MSVKIRSFVVRFVQIYDFSGTLQIFFNFFGNFMEQEEKLRILNDAYEHCLKERIVNSKKEFADYIGIHRTTVSSAFGGNEQYLTDKFIGRVLDAVYGAKEGQQTRFSNISMIEKQNCTEDEVFVPLIPTGARAGTLADFAEAVKEYDVEKIVSPVRGADYAIQVTGDSMAPEYEKIFEAQFVKWGKTYVLDSDNGAVIKKIFPTEDAAVVECRSVNPAYPPFRVRTEHVHGWYRVLMIMALK